MQCIIMENSLIKLTLHDETKKRAHDSQQELRIDIKLCVLDVETYLMLSALE